MAFAGRSGGVDTLTITSDRRTGLIVTELAVMESTAEGLTLKKLASGVDVDTVQRATDTGLIVPDMTFHLNP